MSVLLISFVLTVLGRLAMRRTMPGGTVMQWHFFFLGAGFLLLEVQIISKMALLFGTTWLVTSIVIIGLLLLIVGANILVEFVRVVPAGLAYSGLFASVAVSYLFPLDALFFQSVWLRGGAAIGVLCLPVFFAGIIFIQGFARVGFSSDALGSNLMGSLVGGLLESLSFWTGIKALLLLAALLYLFSYFALDKLPKKTPLPAATTPDTEPAKANG